MSSAPIPDWILVIPPVAKPSEPTPGVLVLAAHLRERGLEVVVVDANLATHRALLAPSTLDEAVSRLVATGASRAALTSARRAAHKAPEAWDRLRSPDLYRSHARYRDAVARVGEAHTALGRSRGGRITLSDMETPGLSPLASGSHLRIFQNPSHLPVAAELERTARSILAFDPKGIAVSATFLSQALPATTLAGQLRRLGYRGTLVLGGALVGAWVPRLTPTSPLFQCWDALVAGPGESPLSALAENRFDTTGVLAPCRGVWRPPTPLGHPAVRFRPDTEGLPWSQYRGPGPVLPLALARGCYWRRCAFCPEPAQGGTSFAVGPPEALGRQLAKLAETRGIHRVHLTDEAAPLGPLRAFARSLRGSPIRWYGFVRPEPALADPDLAADLAEGGCVMLQLGIESASQAWLDRTAKGTRADDAGPIVRNLHRAGIRTFVYLLFGLPGETEAEAETTRRWVRDHRDAITFLNLARFHLPRGSRLESEAAGLGAVWSRDDPSVDLSLYRPFDTPGPWDRTRVRRYLADLAGDDVVRPILARTPPGFTVNHAAWLENGNEKMQPISGRWFRVSDPFHRGRR